MAVSLNMLKERSVQAMGAVDPHIHDLALQVVEKAFKEGIFVQIISGFRSFAEQDALYAQGRTKTGSIVTHARAGQSIHNYGLAVDFLILHTDGSANWNVNEDWHKVGAIGKSLGFDWGGDWTSFKDWGHLEYTQGHGWIDLKEGWRPTFIEQMSKVIPTKSNEDLLQKGDKGAAVKELQEKLLKAGEKLPRYGADSDFGDETENAVKAFQAGHGLKVDGIPGPKTMAKLDEVLSEKEKPKAKPKENGIPVIGQIKIVNVSKAAYICDRPSSVHSKNLATAKKGSVWPISGSVPGWFEVIYKGRRAYVNEKYGKRV